MRGGTPEGGGTLKDRGGASDERSQPGRRGVAGGTIADTSLDLAAGIEEGTEFGQVPKILSLGSNISHGGGRVASLMSLENPADTLRDPKW